MLSTQKCKSAVLAILLMFTIASVKAQGFHIGPKLGVNLSNYQGGDFDSNARIGYHFGVIASWELGSVFAVQTEALYSTGGAKFKENGFNEKVKTSYISVPVMLKLRSHGGLYFELGPQVSFKTNEDIPSQTISKFANNLDLSAGIGLGYQASNGLGIGARYLAGLSKVGDFSGQEIDPDFKNSNIQVSIFWLW